MEFRIKDLPAAMREMLEAIDLEVGGADGLTSVEEIRSLFEGDARTATLWESFSEPREVRRAELEVFMQDHFLEPTNFDGTRTTIEADGTRSSADNSTLKTKIRKTSDHKYEVHLWGRRIVLGPSPSLRPWHRTRQPVSESRKFKGVWADEKMKGVNRGTSYASGNTSYDSAGTSIEVELSVPRDPEQPVAIEARRIRTGAGGTITQRREFRGLATRDNIQEENVLPDAVVDVTTEPRVVFPTDHTPSLTPTGQSSRGQGPTNVRWYGPNHELSQWPDAELRRRFPGGIAATKERFAPCLSDHEAMIQLLHTMARSKEITRARDPRMQVLERLGPPQADVDVVKRAVQTLPKTGAAALAVRRFAAAYSLPEDQLRLKRTRIDAIIPPLPPAR